MFFKVPQREFTKVATANKARLLKSLTKSWPTSEMEENVKIKAVDRHPQSIKN